MLQQPVLNLWLFIIKDSGEVVSGPNLLNGLVVKGRFSDVRVPLGDVLEGGEVIPEGLDGGINSQNKA